MKLRFFAIPVHGADDATVELNQFLGAHRILEIRREFIADSVSSYWAICVTFDDGDSATRAAGAAGGARRPKVDYRDQFTDPEFAVFARLRGLRKTLADAEGVPAFAVFSNEQLAEMVRRRVASAADLGAIPGVGEARNEKYGQAFLRIVVDAALPDAAPPETPSVDHEV